MSNPIPRDFPDLLKDSLVAILRVVSGEQGVGATFHVERDILGPVPKSRHPFVNIWTGEDNPDSGDPMSESRTVTVNLDLYARGEERPDDSDPMRADQAAVLRLDFLRAQVVDGIYRPENRQNGFELGFANGTIGRLHKARWQMFQTDLKMPAEDVVGGRLSIDIDYEWKPSDVAPGPALEYLYVSDTTKDMWAGLYRPAGGT